MKSTYYFHLTILFFLTSNHILSQTGIGTTAPDPNTMLDIVSSDKGVLIPRLQLDDLSTASPLTAPITDGTFIYSEGGVQPDGFYYWEANNWLSFSTVLKKTYTVSTSGGNTTVPHQIPADTDKFETFDGDTATSFILPTSGNSLNAQRQNEYITIQNNSTSSITVVTTNTDMASSLVIPSTQTAIFLFNGIRWVLL